MANNHDYQEYDDFVEPSGMDDLGSETWWPWWADVAGFVMALAVLAGIGVLIDRGLLR